MNQPQYPRDPKLIKRGRGDLEIENVNSVMGDDPPKREIGRALEDVREMIDYSCKARTHDKRTLGWVPGTCSNVPIAFGTGEFVPKFESVYVGDGSQRIRPKRRFSDSCLVIDNQWTALKLMGSTPERIKCYKLNS